ncbi:STAS domain-containing protein [Streptomyces sp. NPDC051582]|uniref:STAS domain-containing protein n=1 Tax=Streptomyces sp. NPDC051582 TaxID=3155167 RepID=UPI00341BF045
MTSSPSTPLRVSCRHAEDALRIELRGDLVHRHADLLVQEVRRALADLGAPCQVRLDCTGMTRVDPSGLSALLMVRRDTDAAGAALHLDGRPQQLEELLEQTGTLAHFTAGAGAHTPRTRPAQEPAPTHAPTSSTAPHPTA